MEKPCIRCGAPAEHPEYDESGFNRRLCPACLETLKEDIMVISLPGFSEVDIDTEPQPYLLVNKDWFAFWLRKQISGGAKLERLIEKVEQTHIVLISGDIDLFRYSGDTVLIKGRPSVSRGGMTYAPK